MSDAKNDRQSSNAEATSQPASRSTLMPTDTAAQRAPMSAPLRALTPQALACANLSGRPLRTVLLTVIVAVFSLLLFTGAMMAANWQTGVASLSARLGADLLVVPQGEGKKIENVLLRAEPSSFYLDESIVEMVRKVPDATAVTPQLFISSLDAQCCSVKVQLIGLDEASDFVVKPWLRAPLEHPLRDDEVIVGHYIVGGVGATVKFFDQPFKIVGELQPSGMGFDSSVFMTMAAARKLGEIKEPARKAEIDKSVSAVLVRVKPGVDPLTISDGVLDQVGLKGGINFVFASALMSDTAAKLRQLMSVMITAGGVLWLVAAGILFTVFSFAYNERAAERATLRALGASQRMVSRIVTLEALMVGLVGSIAGIALGAVVVVLFMDNVAKLVGLPGLAPDAILWSENVGVCLIAGVLTPVLAARVILWRYAKRDISLTMKGD